MSGEKRVAPARDAEDEIASQRRAYRKERESALQELDAKLDELKTKTLEMTAGTREDLDKAWQALGEKRASFVSRLAELKGASGDAWKELKKGVDNSWDELEDAFGDFGKGVKSALGRLRKGGEAGRSRARKKGARVLLVALLLAAAGGAATGEEVVRSYEFAVDRWHEIDAADGPVTLHRIRIDRKEDRLTKAVIARPYNQQYLEPIRFQLDYSNGSSSKWRARITVRWLDAEGRVIDGFSANETLDKKSARKIAQASVATLKYGIQRAETLEVEIRFEP